MFSSLVSLGRLGFSSLKLISFKFQKSISMTRLHMSIEDSSRDETFTALRAKVRPFACVITLMNHQCGPLSKSFAALIARVFPFSGVSDNVSSQNSLAGETFSAHFAGVRLFAGVRSIVDLEALRGLQLFAA